MSQVTSKDGTRIGHESHGSGPAILVVTGATQFRGVDSTSPRLADALADRFTTVLFDRRGRGESGDTAPYAVAREVEDVDALIDAAGGRAALLGHSSGAVLALEAAAALGAKVSALVLYEPPLDPAQPPSAAWAEWEAMDALARRGERAAMLEAFLAGTGMPQDAIAAFRGSPDWAAYESAAPALAHDYRLLAEAVDGGRLPERWRAVAAPTLVITGEDSFGFMAAGADWVAATLPRARRLTLPGEGHAFDPAVLAPVLAEFLGG